jgi:hypothetical protein
MRDGSRSIESFVKQIIYHLASLVAFLCLAPSGAAEASAETARKVDLQLVIALDVSTSMDRVERKLQRDGFAAAFRQPDVLRAIQHGPHGRIAVAVMEWAGETRQNVILDWTVLADAAGVAAFADRLENRHPGRMALGTAVGAAMLRADLMFQESPYDGGRRVINISGDGFSNRGPDPATVRDALIARGITINGLPLVYRDPAEGDGESDEARQPWPDALIRYFENAVIGGAGAFVEPVAEIRQFDEAIRRKLIREIRGPLDVATQGRPVAPAPQAAVAVSSIVPEAEAATRIAATTWPIAARSSAEGPPR